MKSSSRFSASCLSAMFQLWMLFGYMLPALAVVFDPTQLCNNGVLIADTSFNTIYGCDGSSSCSCLCNAGWAGNSAVALVPISGSSPAAWQYDNRAIEIVFPNGQKAQFQNSPYHCIVPIGTGYCSGHGSVSSTTRYRDYEWRNVHCNCALGWVGSNIFDVDPTKDAPAACQINIATDICGAAATPPRSTGYLCPNYCPLSTEVCTRTCFAELPDNVALSEIQCQCTANYQSGPNYPAKQCDVLKPCPFFGGKTCGPNGACGAAQPQCSCNTGYGGQYCCPLSPTVGGTVCGGRGTCTVNGTCACNAGFAGKYCCPIAAGQGEACGLSGTCQQDGTCKCAAGYAGNACQINQQCPSSSPSLECSGNGVCFNEIGEGYVLQRAGFYNPPSVSTTVGGVTYGDLAAVQLLRRFYYNFKGYNETQFAKRFKNVAGMSALCTGYTSRVACYNNLVETYLTVELEGIIVNVAYVQTVLERLFPALGSWDNNYVLAAVTDLQANATTVPSRKQRAGGIVALIAYQWAQDPITGIPVYPNYNAWRCHCSAQQSTDVVGLDVEPGSLDCSAWCPAGVNGQVCSGFLQGILYGQCAATKETCVCGPLQAGNGCEISLQGKCYPTGSLVACGGIGHGECQGTLNPTTGNLDYSCLCNAGWTGQYCTLSVCTPTNQNQLIECSNRGYCVATSATTGYCNCDVSGSLNLCLSSPNSLGCNPNTPPVLPVGTYCQTDGHAQCITSVNVGGGLVKWQECSGQGYCWANSTFGPKCICEPGYSGSHCQTSVCVGCNANQDCNQATQQCACKPFWGNPAGCSGTNKPCSCSASLCGHGIPITYDDITECQCDQYWTKDNTGACTVLQCPLVVMTWQGERPCLVSDTNCPVIANVPSTVALSLQTGCCYDACGSRCRFNSTSGAVSCNCPTSPGYTQQGGICYSQCSGQPQTLSHGVVTCNCNAVTARLAPDEFVNPATCQVVTCLNGGTPNGAGGCNCVSPWTGPTCDTSLCGDRGVLNAAGTSCICTPPYSKSAPTVAACDVDNCAGGQVITLLLGIQGQPYANHTCQCPDNSFVGPNSLSCLPLNCALTQYKALCAQCLNGGTPTLRNHALYCDCSSTLYYQGTYCEQLICLNGGVSNGSGGCTCPVAYQGARCQDEVCQNGVPSTLTPTPGEAVSCVCRQGWGGPLCQNITGAFIVYYANQTNMIPPNTTFFDVAISSSSSSSSTAAAAASSSSTSNPATSAGAIAGYVIAGVVVLTGFGVLLWWLLRTPGASYSALAQPTVYGAQTVYSSGSRVSARGTPRTLSNDDD